MKKLTTALVATIQVATYDLLQVYDTKFPSRNVVAVGRGSRSDTWTQLEAIVVVLFLMPLSSSSSPKEDCWKHLQMKRLSRHSVVRSPLSTTFNSVLLRPDHHRAPEKVDTVELSRVIPTQTRAAQHRVTRNALRQCLAKSLSQASADNTAPSLHLAYDVQLDAFQMRQSPSSCSQKKIGNQSIIRPQAYQALRVIGRICKD